MYITCNNIVITTIQNVISLLLSYLNEEYQYLEVDMQQCIFKFTSFLMEFIVTILEGYSSTNKIRNTAVI